MIKTQKGFTLIELLVVISIIGLLSTLAVVSLNGARLKSRDAKRMSDLKQISTALELYSADNDDAYPINGVCNANGVIAVADTVTVGDNACGKASQVKTASSVYLGSIPEDPRSTVAVPVYYKYEGDSDNYCLQATLENTTNGTYFVCLDGSCYTRATACTETGT